MSFRERRFFPFRVALEQRIVVAMLLHPDRFQQIFDRESGQQQERTTALDVPELLHVGGVGLRPSTCAPQVGERHGGVSV